ncbi:MAG: hypothetical protein ACPG05_01775 [Bdellovibrionales bacterium]
MNKFLLLSSVAVLSISVQTPAYADTKLIYNKDTGAKVMLNAENEVVGVTTTETEVQTEIQTESQDTAESGHGNDMGDDISEDASGGVFVRNEAEADVVSDEAFKFK